MAQPRMLVCVFVAMLTAARPTAGPQVSTDPY